MWLSVDSDQVFGAFCIPPRRSGRNETERQLLVRTLFKQLDTILKKFPPDKITVAGDLNPSDDIDDAFWHAAKSRGFLDAMPRAATHKAGRHLDVVLMSFQRATSAGVRLHDGISCKVLGCKYEHCGDLATVHGTKNFDYFPASWLTTAHTTKHQPTYRLLYSQVPQEWAAAAATETAPAIKAFGNECELKNKSMLWRHVNTAQTRRILEAVAWVWRSLLCATAIASSLVRNGHLTDEHARGTTGSLEQIREDLARAMGVSTQTALGLLNKLSCDSKHGLTNHMALELHTTDLQHGDNYMQTLSGEAEVRDGAVGYILSKAKPPPGTHWGAFNTSLAGSPGSSIAKHISLCTRLACFRVDCWHLLSDWAIPTLCFRIPGQTVVFTAVRT